MTATDNFILSFCAAEKKHGTDLVKIWGALGTGHRQCGRTAMRRSSMSRYQNTVDGSSKHNHKFRNLWHWHSSKMMLKRTPLFHARSPSFDPTFNNHSRLEFRFNIHHIKFIHLLYILTGTIVPHTAEHRITPGLAACRLRRGIFVHKHHSSWVVVLPPAGGPRTLLVEGFQASILGLDPQSYER